MRNSERSGVFDCARKNIPTIRLKFTNFSCLTSTVVEIVACTDTDLKKLVRLEISYAIEKESQTMPKKRFTSEDIIHKLREAEVMSAQGKTVAEISRQLGVTEQTYFRWRKEYGGLKIDQAKRLKELEQENARLRRALSDAVIDNQILREVSRGNF